MRFLTFSKQGVATVGVRDGDHVIDLGLAAPELPGTLLGLVSGGLLKRAGMLAHAAPASARLPLSGIRYLPLLIDPPKMVNLIASAPKIEQQWDVTSQSDGDGPKWPGLTLSVSTRLTAHHEPMLLPRHFAQLDYGIELAVILGKGGTAIVEDSAADHIAGYSILNGGVVRDVPAGQTFAVARNSDASAPFGPELVTPDELPLFAAGLAMTLKRNGIVVQNGTTDAAWSVAEAISRVSGVMSLEAGDVLTMGTIAGTVSDRGGTAYLSAGEVLDAEIEGIGTLSNPVAERI